MTRTAKHPAYIIRELMPDDLDTIAANLRPADAKELEAASGHTNFRDRLTMSVALSSEVRVAECDGVPILVFGIADDPERTGNDLCDTIAAVWAVGTPAVSRFRRALIADSRAVIRRWFVEHPKVARMVNFSHASNALHHRWLRAMGATVLPEEPLGFRGAMFRPFIIERNAPCATPV